MLQSRSHAERLKIMRNALLHEASEAELTSGVADLVVGRRMSAWKHLLIVGVPAIQEWNRQKGD